MTIMYFSKEGVDRRHAAGLRPLLQSVSHSEGSEESFILQLES